MTFQLCFQAYIAISKLNVEDYVWFERPETNVQTRPVPQTNHFIDSRSNNFADIVWFEEPDMGVYNMEHFHAPDDLFGKTNEDAIEENLFDIKDKEYAKYFFLNKWK